MRKTGIILLAGGLLSLFICVVTACVLSIQLIIGYWGMTWGIIAIFIAPVTVSIVPWYALFADGYHIPFLVFYAGGALSLTLAAFGSWLARRSV